MKVREQIKIRIGKMDSLLCRWMTLAKDTDVKFSTMALYAVEYYLRTGEYLNIGAVSPTKHVVGDDDVCYKSIRLSSSPYVMEWVSDNSRNRGFVASTMIKQILIRSIRSVSDDEQEFVMYELDAYNKMTTIGAGAYSYGMKHSGVVVQDSGDVSREGKLADVAEYEQNLERGSNLNIINNDNAHDSSNAHNKQSSDEDDESDLFFSNLFAGASSSIFLD